MTKKQPNRLIIKETIEAGGATKASLKETLKLSASSLATNFTYLRLMGHYVVEAEDKTLSFVDEDAWNGILADRAEKAASRTTAKKRTPQETYDALVVRLKRLNKACDNAEARSIKDGTDMADLRHQKADIELKIATLEFDEFTSANTDTSEDELVMHSLTAADAIAYTAPVEAPAEVEEIEETDVEDAEDAEDDDLE